MVVGAMLVAMTLLGTALAPAGASGGGGGDFRPGAPGVGDDYFPLYGNGGYDVKHYLLKVSYDPATDRLVGVATISARATQNLSSFNLDFVGLTVRSIKVNGRSAGWSRTDHELTVTPRHGLRKGRKFTTVVRYDGVPITQQIVLGPGFTIEAGFIHTDDGAIIAGQPEVAASWFPVNDHPIAKASYTFVVTAPADLEVVANGRLLARKRHGGKRTWLWNAPEPMASYLATVNFGQFDTRRYRTDGLWMYDALDPDLFSEPSDPRTPRRRPSARSPTAPSPARARSSTSWSAGSAATRSRPAAASSMTTTTSSSPWRPRPARSTPSTSSYFFTSPPSGDSVVVHELAHQSCTSWPTSGSATAWPWPSGSTSG
jgi:Peptidase M1 N-terminal domain